MVGVLGMVKKQPAVYRPKPVLSALVVDSLQARLNLMVYLTAAHKKARAMPGLFLKLSAITWLELLLQLLRDG